MTEDGSAEQNNKDSLTKMGMWMLSLLCLWMGILWWRWLLAHMANAHTALGTVVITGVVFVPIALFLFFFSRLLKP